ncbi:MAG TPA: hypothetical protein VGT41_00360 [Candidatus Babeliales bacterium]|nr:hypothetical protein [Candidatus Babeliales bacterium]
MKYTFITHILITLLTCNASFLFSADPRKEKRLNRLQNRLELNKVTNEAEREAHEIMQKLVPAKLSNELQQQVIYFYRLTCSHPSIKNKPRGQHWPEAFKILRGIKSPEEKKLFLNAQDAFLRWNALCNAAGRGTINDVKTLIPHYEECGIDITAIRAFDGKNLLEIAQEQSALHPGRKKIIQFFKPLFPTAEEIPAIDLDALNQDLQECLTVVSQTAAREEEQK